MKKLIKNCNLIDGISDFVKENCWVLIDGYKIEDIGLCSEDELPQAEEVIDAKYRYLLPGLINLHTHIERRHLAYIDQGIFREKATQVANFSDSKRMVLAMKNAWDELKHGITTIRDCASQNRLANALRDLIIKDRIINGPRIIACGFGVACTGGHGTHRSNISIEADGADEIRRAVRMEIKSGADFIKFMASGGIGGLPEREHPEWIELTEEELRAGIIEAHHRGKTTTIHGMASKAIMNALKAGIDGIEHGTKLSQEALDRMTQQGVYLVPTMSGIVEVAEREEQTGSRELSKLIMDLVVFPQRESVSKAYKKGIKIGCGTDSLGDMVGEMELLHDKCDIPKMECIKTATSNAAKICGKENKIGTIEKGKNADLIIVEGNPLEQLSVLRNIDIVIKDGNLVTAQWMCCL